MNLKNYIYCLHHEGHYIFNPDDEDKKKLWSPKKILVSLFNMKISILTTYNFKRRLWMLWCDMLL